MFEQAPPTVPVRQVLYMYRVVAILKLPVFRFGGRPPRSPPECSLPAGHGPLRACRGWRTEEQKVLIDPFSSRRCR